MTYRQWNSVVGLIGLVLLAVWMINDALHMDAEAWQVSAVAAKLLWAALVMVGYSIAGAILLAIVGSIVTGAEFKEERADERDHAVNSRSMRNAYWVISGGGLVMMLLLAMGHDPALGVYTIFGAGMLASAVEAVSQLVYYRLG